MANTDEGCHVLLKLGLLTFALAIGLLAQPVAFTNLAPSGDGSALYFSSQMRMKDSDQYPRQFKIFLWDETNGVRLYKQVKPEIRHAGGPYFFPSNAYNLEWASISSDHRVVAAHRVLGLQPRDSLRHLN